MAPPKGKQPAPSKKTEQKKKEKVIEVSSYHQFFQLAFPLSRIRTSEIGSTLRRMDFSSLG